ncbi:MAG TPA: SurA N-terminal domain-containing protein [Opitutaceae bacterium]|nr:SurA N-terminal domain-containing protein [Opitutaceae bacterium]
MISWIQRYFQHHFKTIFAVLLAVTIISFIFTIGASPGIGRGDRRIVDRYFLDYNLSLPEDQRRLFGDAQLSAQLQLGAFSGLDNDQIQNYAFQRAVALSLADQWHIPAATSAEIADAIKNLRMFAGENGQFDAKQYATFRDNLRTSRNGLTEGDIARVLGNDVRVDKVNKLLAGPGYVLPGDIKTQLLRGDTTWTLGTATADYAAFKPDIKPADAELTKFFEENSFRYEIPPRVVASYVDFPATNYLASVNVTDADVRAYYDANPARFPKPPEPPKPAAAPDAKSPAPAAPKSDPAADFAAVRPQVEAALKLERARQRAEKAASDLALALFEAKVTNGPALDTFLATRKLQAKPLQPFTRDAGPAELGGSPEIAKAAFELNAQRFTSDSVTTPDGAAILFWKDTQPARKPLFNEVREKVLADYVENEKRKRFVELGRTIKSQLESHLKAGDTFDKAAAAAAASTGVKIDAKMLAPFTLRNPPQDLDYSARPALDRLEKGQVSDMTINADKGIFVYAADKKLPDLSEANPRYTETRTQLASYTARMDAQAYISELVQKELKKAELKPE